MDGTEEIGRFFNSFSFDFPKESLREDIFITRCSLGGFATGSRNNQTKKKGNEQEGMKKSLRWEIIHATKVREVS